MNAKNIYEVFISFFSLGLSSFGGPVAHIAYFHNEFVSRKKWISEKHFAQLLAICQFLPGPASSQLGFALGLHRAGWLGAFSAFVGFTLPSAVLLFVFASVLPSLSAESSQLVFQGLKLVACVVVADAVINMAKNMCPDWQRILIACMVAIAIFFNVLAFGVIAGAALAGLFLCREKIKTAEPIGFKVNKIFALAALGIFILLFISLSILSLLEFPLAQYAEALYRSGALVFGGGHVVLPWLEESFVGQGWVNQGDFLAGYGAAQAIPGPLFTFSAYLGALVSTTLPVWVSSVAALIFIFLPGFLLLIAVLPFWQLLVGNEKLVNLVAGLNAGVVGLLAIALYDPIMLSAVQSWKDFLIVITAFAILRMTRCSILLIVCFCVLSKLFFALI